jgi:LuxR family maltose regulon positive regulatory protein
VAWLSIWEGDNELRQFWTRVAAALSLDHAIEQFAIDSSEQLEGDAWVDLLNRYTAAHQPQVLVIDDCHGITDPATLASLSRMIAHLPSGLRLILVGRGHPGFPLERHLLNGDAIVIGETDLRFTVEECAALVALAAGKLLTLDNLQVLTDRSEGWAAGLHLAAMALSDHDNPSKFVHAYSGRFGPVAEYLDHEVLQRQPADVVRFLLQTSVLEYLTADLCEAVTGCRDAGDILQSMAADNLFVVPVEAADKRYRYHRMFADLLKERLQREDSSLGPDAHLNAADWLERHGDIRAAAYHLAEGQAHDRALALLFSKLVPRLDDQFPPGAAALPPPGLSAPSTEEDPGRMYVLAAAWLGGLRVAQASQILSRLDAATADDPNQDRWQGRIEFLWALHAELIADAPGVVEHCRVARDLITPTPEPAHSGGASALSEVAWLQRLDNGISDHLPVLAARAHAWLGQADEAQAMLLDRFGSPDRAEGAAPATLAMVACRQGRLSTAYRLATQALANGEPQDSGTELVSLDARQVLAEVLYEQDELAGAQENLEAALEAALEICGSRGATHWALVPEVDLIRVMMAQQRFQEALIRLGHLRKVDARNPAPHAALMKLNEVEILCRIALGDLEGAVLIARSTPAGNLSVQTLSRIDLCSGRADRAIGRLDGSVTAGVGSEIRRLVLLSCAEMQRGRVTRASESLRRAIEAGRPEGYVRPFLEEAPRTLPLMRRVLGEARADPYLTQLVYKAGALCPGMPANESSPILEPLTDREREVLGYLPSHLKTNQIAARMYVAPSTVKSYMKALYRKIGVGSRAEAVTLARVYGLL